MNNTPPIAVWTHLRDPDDQVASSLRLVDVELNVAHWRKIVTKHIDRDRSQPWEELLPETVLSTLRSHPLGPYDNPPAQQAVIQAIAAIEGEVRDSLSRPLVMTFEQMTDVGRRSHVWWLILPSGATAIIERQPSKNILKTCYYSGAAGRNTKRGERWRRVAELTLKNHAMFDPATQQHLLPDSRHCVEKSMKGKNELWMEIQFVTPAEWGFDLTQPNVPWAKTFPRWTATQPTAPRSPGSALPNILRNRKKMPGDD